MSNQVLNHMNQEVIALGIVAVAGTRVGFRIFQEFLATPLSKWLLSHNQVKLAMWMRKKAVKRGGSTGSGCDGGGCSNCS